MPLLSIYLTYILLAASPARAAPVAVQVGGLGKAQSVIAVVRDAAGGGVGACNDAAVAPDAAVDGVWSCQTVEVAGDAADVQAIVDGRLVSGGVLSWDAGAAHTAAIWVASGIVQISTDQSTLPTVPGSLSAPGAAIVLGRLTGYGTGAAPVLILGGGAAQLFCHDDGQFPDRVVNDGEPGCSGPVGSAVTDLTLHSGDGTRVPVGSLVWGAGPIQYTTVDVASSTSSSAPFDLPLPPLPQLAPTPNPQAAAGEAAVGQADAATGTAPPPPAPPPPPPLPDASPAHASGVGSTLFGPWPWIIALAAAVIGGGALSVKRQRSFEVRPTLRPHPSPPLFPGGPTWGQAAVLRVDEPVRFLTELLGTVVQQRRVVVALPGPVDLPPIGGAGVWVAMVPTWDEVAAGVAALARTDGAPVALLVLGGATVTDPGAVTPDALSRLSRALPPGVWMGVVVESEEVVATWMPVWRVTGQPWEGERLA
ncbi:MAG: hypothetical protein EXR69_03825 [Myxococcales bacterium]|nr:hypothetical protein [Myxococcales bacterium]